MKKARDQHVYPHFNGGWAVKNAGSRKPVRVVETLGEATSIAVERAMKRTGQVILHGTDQIVSLG